MLFLNEWRKFLTKRKKLVQVDIHAFRLGSRHDGIYFNEFAESAYLDMKKIIKELIAKNCE